MTTAVFITALALAAGPAGSEPPAAINKAPTFKRAPAKPVSARTLAAAEAILAQQLPPGAVAGRPQNGQAGQGERPVDNGQALVELIQQTVSPASWDINGGLGSIVFFPPRNVIVVRSGGNGDTHRAVGDALGQLRRN